MATANLGFSSCLCDQHPQGQLIQVAYRVERVKSFKEILAMDAEGWMQSLD